MQLPDDELERLFEELKAAAADFAGAKARRFGLEEQRKIRKNELMLVAEASGAKSRDRQERYAYTHPTYKLTVDKLLKAIEEEVNAEYAVKLVEMRWESWRSIGANMRAARM